MSVELTVAGCLFELPPTGCDRELRGRGRKRTGSLRQLLRWGQTCWNYNLEGTSCEMYMYMCMCMCMAVHVHVPACGRLCCFDNVYLLPDVSSVEAVL